jgi:4'-phosphopantetheinyl transferase EntD
MPEPGAFGPLLPHDVAVVAAGPDDALGPLWPEEQSLVSKASDRRVRHFRGGRWCAREALRVLGGPDAPLGAGPRGEPAWPPGFVGSITHCDRLYAAAVGSAERYVGIGIDVEGLQRRTEAIRRMTCTADELAWADARGGDADRCLLLVFSAKESFFKCWFPVRQTVPEYEAVQIDVDLSACSFDATLGELRLTGRFAFVDPLVYTAVTWQHEVEG